MPHRGIEPIVFIDSSAIVGVLNKRDQHHQEAKAVYATLKRKRYKLVLTNYIVAESHALILREKRPDLGFTLLDILCDPKEFALYFVSEELEKQARGALPSFRDKCWSLTDMISFTVMQQLDVGYYFSYDADFRETSEFTDITQVLTES